MVETLPSIDARLIESAGLLSTDALRSSVKSSGVITSNDASSFDAAPKTEKPTPTTPTIPSAITPTSTTTPSKDVEVPKLKEDKREIGLKRLKGRFANLSDTINQMGEYAEVVRLKTD